MTPEDVSTMPDDALYAREHALRGINDKDKSPEEYDEAFRLVKEIHRRGRNVFVNPDAGSVFHSQLPVNSYRSMIYLTERELERLKARLEELTAAHRKQIRKSLTSKIPEERDAARSIAAFWEVPLEQ